MKRTNAGYKIIISIKLPNKEYVLGEKIKPSGNEYVTWCYINHTYYFGHYFYNKEVAIKDLYQRAKDELDYLLEEISSMIYYNKIKQGE